MGLYRLKNYLLNSYIQTFFLIIYYDLLTVLDRVIISTTWGRIFVGLDCADVVYVLNFIGFYIDRKGQKPLKIIFLPRPSQENYTGKTNTKLTRTL